MNHLESAFSGKNAFWRYLIMGVIILIITNSIGAIPLLIALLIKSGMNPAVFTQFASNPNDFSAIGIDSTMGLIIMVFPFIAGLAAFILLVKPINNRSFKKVINGTGSIRWNRFFISFALWMMISAIYLFGYLKINPENFALNNKSASLITLIVISVLFIPFQASFEEVFFRGYLMQGFAVMAKNRWFPVIMTSILFGLLHSFNPEVRDFGFMTMMPQYMVFGLIFGVIAILDDGIEATMGAHAANNAFLCIMVTNQSSALQTKALYVQNSVHPWIEFIGLILSGIIFIAILNKLFKWNNFRVLLGKINPSK